MLTHHHLRHLEIKKMYKLPSPVAVLVLFETKHTFEVVLEGKVQGLSREVTEDIGHVTTPELTEALFLDDTGETVANALVGGRETTGFDHLILILFDLNRARGYF